MRAWAAALRRKGGGVAGLAGGWGECGRRVLGGNCTVFLVAAALGGRFFDAFSPFLPVFFKKIGGGLHAAVQEQGARRVYLEGMRQVRRCKSREEIIQYLEKLVFYRPNDGIRIAFTDEPSDLKNCHLEGISEFKRYANGTVEMKFLDRLKALELLVRLQGEPEAEGGGLEAFLSAVSGGEEA